jgi:hypothetical protein
VRSGARQLQEHGLERALTRLQQAHSDPGASERDDVAIEHVGIGSRIEYFASVTAPFDV